MPPRIALSGHTKPRACLRPGWNPDFHHFRLRKLSVAVASGTGVSQSSLAVATRAGEAELHRARHLSHVSRAIALWTYRGRVSGAAAAAAGIAGLLMHDVQAHLSAPNGLPKIDVQPVFEIRPLFGNVGPLPPPPSEKLAKDVPESARALGMPGPLLVHEIRKIEPAEPHPRTIGPAAPTRAARSARRDVVRIKSVLIVNL